MSLCCTCRPRGWRLAAALLFLSVPSLSSAQEILGARHIVSSTLGKYPGQYVLPSPALETLSGRYVLPSSAPGPYPGQYVLPSSALGTLSGRYVLPSSAPGPYSDRYVLPSSAPGAYPGQHVLPSPALGTLSGRYVLPSSAPGQYAQGPLRTFYTPGGRLLRLLKEDVLKVLSELCPPAEQTPGWRCSCPSGFIVCGGRCYRRLNTAVDYAQAEADCAAIGTYLAVPRSRDQNLCVAGLAGYERIWLGVTDRDDEGVFQGADGSPLTGNEGQVWARHQPDDAGHGEDCVEIRTVGDNFRFAEWNDVRCGASVFPMCQLPDTAHF